MCIENKSMTILGSGLQVLKGCYDIGQCGRKVINVVN
jgi:hypothetical protein